MWFWWNPAERSRIDHEPAKSTPGVNRDRNGCAGSGVKRASAPSIAVLIDADSGAISGSRLSNSNPRVCVPPRGLWLGGCELPAQPVSGDGAREHERGIGGELAQRGLAPRRHGGEIAEVLGGADRRLPQRAIGRARGERGLLMRQRLIAAPREGSSRVCGGSAAV